MSLVHDPHGVTLGLLTFGLHPVDRYDEVARAQSGFIRRTTGAHLHHPHTVGIPLGGDLHADDRATLETRLEVGHRVPPDLHRQLRHLSRVPFEPAARDFELRLDARLHTRFLRVGSCLLRFGPRVTRRRRYSRRRGRGRWCRFARIGLERESLVRRHPTTHRHHRGTQHSQSFHRSSFTEQR